MQGARFHKAHDPATWRFTEAHVIAFLRAQMKAGEPAWKRVMMVNGLINYRKWFLKSHEPALEHIRGTLQKWALREREKEDTPDIEEVAGKIDPREPDVIQALRRTLRRMPFICLRAG